VDRSADPCLTCPTKKDFYSQRTSFRAEYSLTGSHQSDDFGTFHTDGNNLLIYLKCWMRVHVTWLLSSDSKGHTIFLLIQSTKQPNHSSVQIRFAAAKKEAADLEPVLIFWFSLKANAKGKHRELPKSPSIRKASKGHTIFLLIQSIKQPNHSSVQIRFAAAKKEAADL
jgi:hypothetical protein